MKICYLIVLLTVVTVPSVLQSVHAQQSLYGRPARLRSLADLNLLEGNDLATSQKTEVLLSWLAEERDNPSPTTAGHGGGPIDTDYLQAQIIKALETKGDPLAVGWVSASTSVKDQSTRDGMRLVLGFMGDKGQIPAMEKILTSNTNPYFRAMAAENLGLLGAVFSIPTLKSARKDAFSVSFASEQNEGKLTTFYPVRQVVEETINILGKPGLLAQEKQRGQFFAAKVMAAKKYALAHKLSPSHFVRIANRSRAPGKRAPGA